MKIYRETLRDIRKALALAAALPDSPLLEQAIPARFYARCALQKLDSDLTPSEVEVESPACPHGMPIGKCNDCDVASDFAYDAAREDAFFGRRG